MINLIGNFSKKRGGWLILSILCVNMLLTPVFADKYITDGTDCDGYPRVLVGTAKGMCLGLVVQASQGYPFVKPRKIIQVPNTKKFLITDMGGWSPNKGTLWLIDTAPEKPRLISLLKGLNLPHGLAIDSLGRFYVGEKHQIIRFSLDDNNVISKLTPVVTDLPAWKGHRHPLSAFIIDQQNNLIVNTAAPSDQCKKNDNKFKACSEYRMHNTDNAAIRKYIYKKDSDSWNEHYSVIASGLRNSMALAQHQSGTILQAENNMDFEGLDTPFEEINVIQKGKFYGWPYCYDKNTINRFWTTSAKKYCLNSDKYQAPWVAIAPHSAPLDMMYYTGEMFPELKGKLILSWHGYRKTGQRIVSYEVDELGRPIQVHNATYSVYGDNGALPTKHKFPISQPSSRTDEIIGGWNPIKGYRPKGRPVGMTVAKDGSIWILDDTNKAVLRLSKGQTYSKKILRQGIKIKGIKVKDNKVAELFKQHCSVCHNEIISTISTRKNSIMLPMHWLEKVDNNNYLIETRLFDSTLPQMPPGKTLAKKDKAILKRWLKEYKNLNK